MSADDPCTATTRRGGDGRGDACDAGNERGGHEDALRRAFADLAELRGPGRVSLHDRSRSDRCRPG